MRRLAARTEERFRDFPDSAVEQRELGELVADIRDLVGELGELSVEHDLSPYDDDTIRELGRSVQRVAETIERAADLLDVYNVEAAMEQSLEQCSLLVAATDSVAQALSQISDPSAVEYQVSHIERMEKEGDTAVRAALGALFETEGVDPLIVVRWKDIFEFLEAALDGCERVARLLRQLAPTTA